MKRLFAVLSVLATLLFFSAPAFSSDLLFSSIETYRVNLGTNTLTLLSSVVPSANLANCTVEWQVMGSKIWWAEGGISTSSLVLSRSMTAGEAKSINVSGQSFDLSFIADSAALSSITITIYKP